MRETELELFRSYLSGRRQHVLVNNLVSSYAYLTHSVPQGSCLGPLLFLVYINNITNYLPEDSLHLYADDTAVIATGHDRAILCAKLQSYTDKLKIWC